MESDRSQVKADTSNDDKQNIQTTENISDKQMGEVTAKTPDMNFDRGAIEEKHYSTLKHVGQGTFGVVKKAMDNRTKRYVAIKKIPIEMGCPTRELQLLQEMKHPNCIYVLNSFHTEEKKNEESPKRYMNIVLEYIPDNLYKIISHYSKARANFPDTLGMVYSYQLFRCLHYLQAVKIMHRDIKPQNVLVDTKRHQIFVCDFGSAKRFNSDEPSASYICSRFYRAPELLLGNETYGSAVDLWSVGCVMAEMYLGIPIFIGENSKDQLKKIAEIIGYPDDYDLRAMGVKKADHFDGVKPSNVKKRLTGKANPQAIDLISKVLLYNPEKRIRPLDALLHPYFDPLRERKITINKQEIVDLFNFMPEEMKGNERLIAKLTPAWYYKTEEYKKSK